jgi:hypothetical protein
MLQGFTLNESSERQASGVHEANNRNATGSKSRETAAPACVPLVPRTAACTEPVSQLLWPAGQLAGDKRQKPTRGRVGPRQRGQSE